MSWAYCAPKSTTRTVSGAWAAGVAEDTRCLPAVGRELVPPDSTGGSRPGRPPPSAPVGSRQLPSAPVSSRLTIRSGLDARPGRGILEIGRASCRDGGVIVAAVVV